MGDLLFPWFQSLLPQHLLSGLAHRVTRSRSPRLKNALIRWFIRKYRADLSFTLRKRPEDYPDFNAFFTRGLQPGARPIAGEPGDVACPVDGVMMQVGRAEGDALIQAKGKQFDLVRLLGGSAERAAAFRDGAFATIYLSPREYHRVHMPVRGTLREMAYVPGRLFGVSPRTSQAVSDLFSRNERVVALFDTVIGPVGLVLVGALLVGNIETAWHGVVTLPRGKRIRSWDYGGRDIVLERGEEMGRFNMGSTIILLFPPGSIRWAAEAKAGAAVKMGQRIGQAVERG